MLLKAVLCSEYIQTAPSTVNGRRHHRRPGSPAGYTHTIRRAAGGRVKLNFVQIITSCVWIFQRGGTIVTVADKLFKERRYSRRLTTHHPGCDSLSCEPPQISILSHGFECEVQGRRRTGFGVPCTS